MSCRLASRRSIVKKNTGIEAEHTCAHHDKQFRFLHKSFNRKEKKKITLNDMGLY